MKRHAKIWSLLIVLALLIVACGSAADTPVEEVEEVQSAESSESEEAEEMAEEPAILRWGTFMPPGYDLDPNQAVPSGTIHQLSLIYDNLVNLGTDGQLEPGLATSWTVGDSIIEMDLREGVLFHDGTPFDAEAVKANIEYTQASGAPPHAIRLASIESVEVVDTLQVRLNLVENDPVLLYALTRQPGMMVSPAGFDTAQENPLGTGPYMLNADETTLDSLYTFDAFPDFYDADQQGFDQVILINYPEQVARANALTSGEIDGAVITGADAAELEGQGFSVAKNISVIFALMPLDINGEVVPELADPLVREALQYAIDRDALIDVIEGGIGSPTQQLYSDPEPWFVADLPDYSYDPDKAMALLEEAGVTDLSFQMPVAPIFADRTQALAGLLQNVGINVELVPVDLPHTATYTTGEYGVLYGPVEVLHPKDFAEQYFTERGLYNVFGNSDPEILALYEEAKAAGDEDSAEPIWEELIKKAIEKNYLIFSANISESVVASPDLEGTNLAIYTPITPTWRSMSFK